jgi:hypothetical protein
LAEWLLGTGCLVVPAVDLLQQWKQKEVCSDSAAVVQNCSLRVYESS